MSRIAQARSRSGPELYAVLIIAGIALVAVGVASGDFWAILANARMICLSCIGIQ
ncbi:MAG: thioredoxin [Bacillota bacterium]